MEQITFTLIAMSVVFIFIIAVLILALCIFLLQHTRMKSPLHLPGLQPANSEPDTNTDQLASETQNFMSPSCPLLLFTHNRSPAAEEEIVDTGNVQHYTSSDKPEAPSPQCIIHHCKAFSTSRRAFANMHVSNRMTWAKKSGHDLKDECVKVWACV